MVYIVVRDLIRGDHSYWHNRADGRWGSERGVHHAHEIHAQLHVWSGGHDSGYWHSHLRQYFAFYARHCA